MADLLAQVESYQEQGYYVVGYVSYEVAPAFEEKLAVYKALYWQSICYILQFMTG